MSRKIRGALLGLGEVGQDFAEMFLERIQAGGRWRSLPWPIAIPIRR